MADLFGSSGIIPFHRPVRELRICSVVALCRLQSAPTAIHEPGDPHAPLGIIGIFPGWEGFPERNTWVTFALTTKKKIPIIMKKLIAIVAFFVCMGGVANAQAEAKSATPVKARTEKVSRKEAKASESKSAEAGAAAKSGCASADKSKAASGESGCCAKGAAKAEGAEGKSCAGSEAKSCCAKSGAKADECTSRKKKKS